MTDRHVRTESEDDARDTARDRRYQAGGTGMAGPAGATERTQGAAARPAPPRRGAADLRARDPPRAARRGRRRARRPMRARAWRGRVAPAPASQYRTHSLIHVATHERVGRLDIRQSIFLESAAGDAVVAGYFQLRLADVITLRVVRAPLVEQLE